VRALEVNELTGAARRAAPDHDEIFGIPIQAFLGQLMLGLVNGAFYAMLSLGLAVIFGLLDIVNFAHGALYMLGAFAAWIMLDKFGVNYWFAFILAPLIVGVLGVIIERTFLKRCTGWIRCTGCC
jgi:branched-chain amino acid transport system permease protein